MNLLVATAFPHFLSIFPIFEWAFRNRIIFWYVNTIVMSTIFSILYHSTYPKKNTIIFVVDHFISAVWFLYDMYLGYVFGIFDLIVGANLLSFSVHKNVEHCNQYYLLHSMWHLMNASKCFYISYLISAKL
jgi:hypothetical protein